MVNKINIKKALELKNIIFIDTRSPKEFAEDHILEAVSIPILSDEERAVVGTIYKQVSTEQAIEKGKEYYEEKIPRITEKIKKYAGKTLVVYCWRGGMRSAVMSTLFESLGFEVFQLEGGYKSYRKYVRESLENLEIPKLIVLHGLTCSGKTDLIKLLENSIDLEGFAQHRGSLYGSLGLKPNSQKRFDTLLLQRLLELKDEKHIFVEGESRRIGDLMIPERFWKAMGKGVHVYVKRDLDIRAKECVREYFTSENIGKIKEITLGLQKVISKKNKEEIVKLINQKEYVEAAKILLTKYYDELYEHSLKKINYDFEICSDDLDEGIQELEKFTSGR